MGHISCMRDQHHGTLGQENLIIWVLQLCNLINRLPWGEESGKGGAHGNHPCSLILLHSHSYSCSSGLGHGGLRVCYGEISVGSLALSANIRDWPLVPSYPCTHEVHTYAHVYSHAHQVTDTLRHVGTGTYMNTCEHTHNLTHKCMHVLWESVSFNPQIRASFTSLERQLCQQSLSFIPGFTGTPEHLWVRSPNHNHLQKIL